VASIMEIVIQAQDRASAVLEEMISLLRAILARTGFSIDGEELAAALGGPMVNVIRARTGR